MSCVLHMSKTISFLGFQHKTHNNSSHSTQRYIYIYIYIYKYQYKHLIQQGWALRFNIHHIKLIYSCQYIFKTHGVPAWLVYDIKFQVMLLHFILLVKTKFMDVNIHVKQTVFQHSWLFTLQPIVEVSFY